MNLVCHGWSKRVVTSTSSRTRSPGSLSLRRTSRTSIDPGNREFLIVHPTWFVHRLVVGDEPIACATLAVDFAHLMGAKHAVQAALKQHSKVAKARKSRSGAASK